MPIRCWAPKEGGFGGGPTSIGKNTELCASKDAGPRKRVDCEICDVPHWLGGEQNTIYKGSDQYWHKYLLAVALEIEFTIKVK